MVGRTGLAIVNEDSGRRGPRQAVQPAAAADAPPGVQGTGPVRLPLLLLMLMLVLVMLLARGRCAVMMVMMVM